MKARASAFSHGGATKNYFRLFGPIGELCIAQRYNNAAPCQATLEARRRPSLIGEPTQTLLAAQNFHHLENAGRGRAAGERGAQRLREVAELYAERFRRLPHRALGRVRGPVRYAGETRRQRFEARASALREQRFRFRLHCQRACGEQELRAVEQFVQRFRARLEPGHRGEQLRLLCRVELFGNLWPALEIGQGGDERLQQLGVDAYRALGYLPAALRNYLARLGWSQGDKEFFTGDELIEAFDLAQVHRSPARFDFVKLENMNGHFMRAMDDAELLDALVATLPYLKGGPGIAEKLDEKKKAQLLAAMSGLKARAKTLNELLDGAQFLFAARPLPLEAKAESLLAQGGRMRLGVLTPRLAALSDWTAAATEGAVRETAETLGVKLGDLAQPLRAALTGRATSPGIFEVMEILGREESLGRLADQAGA